MRVTKPGFDGILGDFIASYLNLILSFRWRYDSWGMLIIFGKMQQTNWIYFAFLTVFRGNLKF